MLLVKSSRKRLTSADADWMPLTASLMPDSMLSNAALSSSASESKMGNSASSNMSASQPGTAASDTTAQSAQLRVFFELRHEDLHFG